MYKYLKMSILTILLSIILLGVYVMFFKSRSKPQHQEFWVSYHNYVDDDIIFVFSDMGLKEIAPVKNYGDLINFRLYFNDPREDGLFRSEESKTVLEIDNHINLIFEKKYKSFCAGWITGMGKRELYYYLADTKNLEIDISNVMKQYPGYHYEITNKQDKKWEQYFNVLYPTPEQYQMYNNSLVIMKLNESGDDLSKERLVTHWSYFPNETLRSQFIEEVTKQGFELQEDGLTYRKEDEYSYGVIYERVDLIGDFLIDDLTLPLFRLSEKYQGKYDGWETFVIKKDGQDNTN